MLLEVCVGQKIMLTQQGLDMLYGSSVGLSHMLKKVFTVTRIVCRVALNPKEPAVWEIEVDDEDVNTLWLNSLQFRPYEKPQELSKE